MDFFDGNCFLGRPAQAVPRPVPTADDLLAEMDAAGVATALVWHVAQRDYDAAEGNRLLAEAIADHRDRLVGCWSLLPPQTPELPEPDELFARMAEAGVEALRAFPKLHRFCLRVESCGAVLEQMVARRVPLLLSAGQSAGDEWHGVYDLLGELPELVCILCDFGVWGADRWFRPLIERYPNVYVEISQYYLDGGIEAFVQAYGPRRMLYGSGMPVRDYGMMLALARAQIGEADKQAIASGNLQRILSDATF